MESINLIVGLSILFAVIGVGGSLAYYFARYYLKTDDADQELLTKNPFQVGLEKPKVKEEIVQSGVGQSASVPQKSMSIGQALHKTRESLWGRINNINFSGQIGGAIRESIEEILYTSDLGPQTAELLLAKVNASLSREDKKSSELVISALRKEMNLILNEVSRNKNIFEMVKEIPKPTVWMLLGVNGAGKTTTIGKLANLAKGNNLTPIVVAGDTFRAAADSQLRVWADRAGCEIFSPVNVKDPGAVAFAGIEKAKVIGADLVLIDTAGRLHTQAHLMAELEKINRVIGKVMPEAPHEKILVIDANGGQNALNQAREFHKAVNLTGVIVTKLDGTSKAGVVIGIAAELHLPIYYIGVGEALSDLRPFDAKSFIEAII